ncbi:methyltransferase domain-containing protein [Nonomuraea jabiensis]|uniref:23S rRNA G2445 N2-methylase RlmL n=1 Tax=Nonomuraea jabiensis TaxID=882448 RepID=A0A7W9LIP6_9ACTN|nr:methyltransferase domain-containing protein [Nonomuraea jabiensis]MBB5785260.1 23S rRNA G2445 N2-methylase RlmL [Nonomuraea jabiensis]
MHTFAVARAVHGIEALVATEIRRSRLGVVRGVRHREVWFEAAPGADLTGLRTADDVLLAAAVVDGIGHGRSALRRLALAARSVNLGGLAGSGVEVSASFVGRRNYTRFEIEDAVGAELARPLRLPYHSRRDGARPPRDAMSWRVTIEGDRALIALRLADRPLHRRAYKTDSIRGTLHPPVAAAMAALARLGGSGTVLDPCCGAGTTLIEAHALAPDARLLGFDHDPAALRAATANARAAGAAVFGWGVADGGRIPLAGGSVDRVLVNPPWGRQVPPRGLLARDLGPLWREVRRVLAGDGLAVALVHGGIPRGFVLEEAVRVSLSGQHPVIAVLRKEAGRVRR